MLHTAATVRRPLSQVLVVCCVLVAISLFGLSSTLVSLLGTNHVHTRQARIDSETLVLEDFRRVAHHGRMTARPSQEHLHSLWQRHRHEAADPSVQSCAAAAANDSLSGDVSASALAAIVLMAGAADGLAVPGLSAAMAWVLSAAQRLPDCDPDPLERPPKA